MGVLRNWTDGVKRRLTRPTPSSRGQGRKQKSLQYEDPSGVFVSTRTLPHTPPASMHTIQSASSAETSDSTSGGSWNSTGTRGYHRHSPLIVKDPEASTEVADEAEALGLVMARSRRLPTTWYYSSNHVMVNMERTKRTVAPLTRMRELDEIARVHAETMVAESRLYHMDPSDLSDALNRPATRRLGCNVNKGISIDDIHLGMMATLSNRNNIIDRRYTHMGMATARDDRGVLYLCQIFRG
ncbi:predicted protein [Phaeodactylum tricornutum CCAP 1055/1]|jgi:uncharacterized protein YkwD|uniref:SCP domain-containing protein n=1 Tax=Phaeodactylum tricornutum (strain CCAP 1055/1) TaxID=556484 RepID=B7FTB4_PHATC|nr:predicted protein [Phaeodactylum tricornutum CCAP 1055/1]EEC50627.1 predicted protein [Phaeodactylum tricornutum CCAP 1055/1]|eukprot:XP_002177813.1 predicted protein [Phaeodactylum tricornutum CCAP 1055/1]